MRAPPDLSGLERGGNAVRPAADAGSLESFFLEASLDRVRGGLIQCINKIVRHLADL